MNKRLFLVKKQKKKQFEKPILTREELTKKLKQIFKKHIGRENAITKQQLYTKVFGDASYYDPYELWYNWTRIKHAMNWLRRTSKYFIVSRTNDKHKQRWEYYIVKDFADAEQYQSVLRGTKRKIDVMLARCDEAIAKKFWLDIKKGKD